MEQLQCSCDSLKEILASHSGVSYLASHPANFGHRRKSVVHFREVAVGFPRIAPGPVDAEPSFCPEHTCGVCGSGCKCVAAERVPMTDSFLVAFLTDSYCLAVRSPATRGIEGSYTRQEEVSAASNGGESRQARDFLANGPLRDRHVKRAILGAEERIALVA